MSRMKKTHMLLESRIPGLPEPRREKTRDIYDLGDRILWVETDRLLADGVVFPTAVPDKGRFMFCLSSFWKDFLKEHVRDDTFSKSLASLNLSSEHEGQLLGRVVLAKKTDPLPRVFFVAGYRTATVREAERAVGAVSAVSNETAGGGVADGKTTGGGAAGGDAAGGTMGERLAAPVVYFLSPDGSGAEGAADGRARMVEKLGEETTDATARLAVTLYEKAAARALERGFILAETRFTFGLADGHAVLTGHVLNPEVSTYWLAEECQPGQTPADCVWRPFRDWLARESRRAPPPAIPGKTVQAIHDVCHDTAEKLIGNRLVFSQPATGRRLRLRLLGQSLALAGVRLFVAGMSRVPLGPGRWLGRRIGDIWWLLDRSHRKIAENQAERCLHRGPAATRRLIHDNFRHYGMVMTEVSRLARMNREDFVRLVDFDGFKEFAHELLAEGRGILFITGHFGNWEWMNSTATALEMTGGSIARPLDNPGMNEFLRSLRERNGLTIIDKRGAIRKARQMLTENRMVGVLIDQDAGAHGIVSPFLGRPGSTITIPVELALRTGSPMVTGGLRRGGANGKAFTMLYNRDIRRPDLQAEPEAETKRLIDQLNDDLGKIIMQAPEQWFWRHRRWKSMSVR